MSEVKIPVAENEEAPTKVNTQGFIGRQLHDHRNNRFNRECIRVETADYRASDGAHHAYRISVSKEAKTSDEITECVHQVLLQFQNGGLKEVGPNGITDQSLIAIVLDRIRSFNEGHFRCRENSMAITKLEEALHWMQHRADDRARRNVEGERLA